MRLNKTYWDNHNWVVHKIVLDELCRVAPIYASGIILDIGCGTKPFKSVFAPYVKEHIGLDHKDSLHDLSEVDIIADSYNTTLPDKSVDTILCTAVLEHLERPWDAIREMYRVLKSSGCAILTVPLFWHLHEEPSDFYRYTEYGLKYLFENAGFEIIELKPLSGFLVTFFTELGYYLQRFKKGPLSFLVDALVAVSNCLIPRLDSGILRNEKFTWMYLVVVRKPE